MNLKAALSFQPNIALLKASDIGDLLRSLGFSSGTIEALERAALSLESSDEWEAFQGFCRLWPTAENTPPPQFANSLWLALAVVQAFPGTIAMHSSLKVPFQVTADTLRDLERKICEYQERTGVLGFDRLGWMRSHLVGDLFAIGRLQYHVGHYRDAFTIFRNSKSREEWALANDGLQCCEEGWPAKVSRGFITSLQKSRHFACGHLADGLTGAVRREMTRLPDGTEQVLCGGEPVLHVHIPAGPKLDREACLHSLRSAREFYSEKFPHISFRAICCRTWLLDRSLENVLPSGSNILSFGKLFRPLAVVDASDSQHLQRIFGEHRNWRGASPSTRLQQAAQHYLLNGGIFRLTSGYLLWDDPNLLVPHDRQRAADQHLCA